MEVAIGLRRKPGLNLSIIFTASDIVSDDLADEVKLCFFGVFVVFFSHGIRTVSGLFSTGSYTERSFFRRGWFRWHRPLACDLHVCDVN